MAILLHQVLTPGLPEVQGAVGLLYPLNLWLQVRFMYHLCAHNHTLIALLNTRAEIIKHSWLSIAGHCNEWRWESIHIGALCYEDDNCGAFSEIRSSNLQFRHPNYTTDDRGTTEEYDLRLIQLNQISTITPVEIDDGTLTNEYEIIGGEWESEHDFLELEWT